MHNETLFTVVVAFSGISKTIDLFPAVSCCGVGETVAIEDLGTSSGLIQFELNDSISSFKVWVEGVSTAGALGSNSVLLTSSNPFYLEYKLPIEVFRLPELASPCIRCHSTIRLSFQLDWLIRLPKNLKWLWNKNHRTMGKFCRLFNQERKRRSLLLSN